MLQAIQFGIMNVFINTPWYFVGGMAFEDNLRIRKRSFYLCIVIIALLDGVGNFWLLAFARDFNTARSVFKIAYYSVIVLLFLLSFRVFVGKLLYVFLIIQALATTINYVAYLLNMLFLPTGTAIGYGDVITYPLTIIVGIAVTLPLLWRFFKKRLRPAFEEMSNKSVLFLCVTPILFFIIQIFMSNINFRYVLSNKGAEAVYNKVFTIVVYLLVVVTGLITYYINIQMMLESAHRARLEAENHAQERQLRLQVQSYEQLMENIDQGKAVRHDVRHHLSVIRGHAQASDIEAVLAYLEEYTMSLPGDNEPPVCENHVVDVLVRHYLRNARGAGAKVEVKLVVPQDIGISNTDLCIVFGNLFENAAQSVIRQTEGERFVQARCETTKSKLVLTLDNSCPAYEAKDGRQGGGLSSVAAVARKYHGTVRFNKEGTVYKSSVILSKALFGFNK